MDDRQTEIRAGAGLEDSRINKEFIDFLNKWSSPVIMVFAVAALVWAGLRWMEQKKLEKKYTALDSISIGLQRFYELSSSKQTKEVIKVNLQDVQRAQMGAAASLMGIGG